MGTLRVALAWAGSDWRLPFTVAAAFSFSICDGWLVGVAFDWWDFERQLQERPVVTQILPGRIDAEP